MPDSTETFGQRCTRLIFDRYPVIASVAGLGFSSAQIIDAERQAVIDAHKAKNAPPSPISPPPASSTLEDFGDRKKIPPTPDQVARYSRSRGKEIDGQAFCDFYQSKGWLVGKAKMKDWQAATRTAIAGDYFRKPSARDTGRPGRDPSKF